ncbi:MAG: hypothetical protein R3F34_07520 [Planctomycetota bacterium]
MSFLRRSATALVAGALALVASCATAPPTPEELVAIGFRSPEQTFRTFQAAVGADLIDLEYRCYASEFKKEWKITQGNYRVARKELFAQMPWVRRISRAEIRGTTYHETGLAQIDARVSFLLQTVDIEVYLVRDGYFEVWSGDERLDDGSIEFRDAIRRVSEGEQWDREERFVATIELESPVPPAIADRLDQVTELVVGQEWRIAGMRVRDGSAAP